MPTTSADSSLMHITSPPADATFRVTADAIWPSIIFEVDVAPSNGEQLTWEWSIGWANYSRQGVARTNTKRWDAGPKIENLGGRLHVKVTDANGKSAHISVSVVGSQPDKATVESYLASRPDSAGFDKILIHETDMQHFGANGDPKKSFDDGFGMAQLTNPAPSYEQVWNWKMNVDAGLELFLSKRNLAVSYLSENNRTYTSDQL